MNRNKLRVYAPQARHDFIKAVTDRAAYYGLTQDKIEPITEQGDVAMIAGKAFPRAVAAKRKRLEERIRQQVFEQVMEAMAYTWFNRFVAIRFMELHGYLDHGYRVLSHPEGSATPEIVEHAEHVDLPGLDRDKVIELKLEGTKEAELYRLLLIAQCNALHKAMPFLFEWVDDETELLLPENLLHSDSLIRKLVNGIPEEDWQEVEIIGWLYQFYISEKKDEVIGKVVKSEDIPAATQLFTPNWIVKYLVQNTLGRQWMATYPNSSLNQQMEFYIEPAEQTPEVQEQLKAITPKSLNPEEFDLLDPACGSGHILVEVYDLLKAIYQERGYRKKDIPRLVLEKNLYGLEIDDRAAQLAAFALMMKARADDRRIFENGTQPNVLAIQESKGTDVGELAQILTKEKVIRLVGQEQLFPELEEQMPLGVIERPEIRREDMVALLELFTHGKTVGSLIKVSKEVAVKLPLLKELMDNKFTKGDMFERTAAGILKPFWEQASYLAGEYDFVVTNPPYMGSKGMNADLKDFAKQVYSTSKSDLFAMFIERGKQFGKITANIGYVTPYVWMFLSSYEEIRKQLIDQATFTTLVQLEYNAFEPACIPVCTFVLHNSHISGYTGSHIKLSEFKGHQNQAPKTLEAIRNPDCGWFYAARPDDFKKIPGSPMAYWVSDRVREIFEEALSLSDIMFARKGIATGNNDLFLRQWHEVSVSRMVYPEEVNKCMGKWYTTTKGGGFRKWYGNHDYVVNWENNGYEIKNYRNPDGSLKSRPQNTDCFFKGGITWSDLTSSQNAFRELPLGFAIEGRGPGGFLRDKKLLGNVLSFLNSKITSYFIRFINPTLSVNVGEISKLPIIEKILGIKKCEDISNKCITLSRNDWDSYETSWDFTTLTWLPQSINKLSDYNFSTAQSCYEAWQAHNREQIQRMQELEEENNRLLIEEYGLVEELTPEVPLEQITITVNPRYRYGGKLSDEVLETRFRDDTNKELVSYAVGCMMGRYSLDKPGLIYAHSGNQGFDLSNYKTFPADEDGIIPITDTDWFEDDAANGVVEFMEVAWPKEHSEENLQFVAENLGPNRGESPRDTIRRYLVAKFYKHHLSMYKKRPIYWLFSSGKQRAFQCLVYFHRYNEGTLSRMRTEYVIPLQGKISARIEQLDGDIISATSTSYSKKLEKERNKLKKQQAELRVFDEKLRHFADQRIVIDLDDGVKVNYGKFGDLLAEVKTVTGRKPNE